MINFVISLVISGKVLDEATSEPMGYTAIMLYKDTTLITGTYTDENGSFIIKDIKPGEYILYAHFIGYEKQKINLTINKDTSIIIKLKPSGIELKEQEVIGTAPRVRYKVDRKIVSPSNDIIARSGSAVDVLRNVPDVSVSPDGNVKVKNSDRYIVFVDGKPTNLNLKDIPASQIEYIEVITNPSAEFDAEGNAIINVILKKQKDYGYSVNVNVNMDSYGTISPNIFYGLKMGNLSTYVRLKGGKTIRKSYFEGKKVFQKDTIFEGATIKFSYLSLIPTFGISYNNFNFETGGRISNVEGKNQYNQTISGINYIRNHNFDESFQSFYLTSDYTYKNIKILGYYSKNHKLYDEIKDSSSNGGVKIITEKPSEKFYGQIDIKKDKFSFGYKGSISNYFISFDFNTISNPKFPYLPSYFISTKRIVNAGYLEFSSNYKNIQYKLGLRVENTQIRADTIKREYTNIFPSLNFSYNFSNHLIYLGYRNGIWRPSDYQLLPLYNYQSFDEIEKGNPTLLPEYSNSASIGLNLNFEKISINPEIYFTRTLQILDINEYPYDTFNVSVKEYINVNEGRNFGFSLNINYNPIQILTLSVNSNVYNYSYENISLTTYEINSSIQAFLLFFALQGNLYYTPRYDYYWGRTGEQIYFQLALMTQIKNYTFSLVFNDPFKIYKFGITVNKYNYYAYKFNRIPYPYITFQLSYNVNKKFKRFKKEENYDVENTGEKFLR